METQAQKELIESALDWVALHRVLRFSPQGQITHAPFALNPYKIKQSVLKKMTELTAPFSELMIKVSQDWDFLENHLGQIAQTDDFLKMLMGLRTVNKNQNRQLLVQRNDFFVTDSGFSQVELNTISASFPFLMTGLLKVHQSVFQDQQNTTQHLVENNPLDPIVDAFADAVIQYGISESVMLVVIQANEGNRLDQRGMEQSLWAKYKIPTLRKTLPEIASEGVLKEGHLTLSGKTVALTYYRAGYTPDDFQTKDAVKGRKLIEASSSIQVPDLPMQLAGMKKIQQVLTQKDVLTNFVSEKTAEDMMKTFVGMYSLKEMLTTPEGEMTAAEMAKLNPHNYVLKPQREGGGNNYFGEEIPQKIANMSEQEREVYILMERIKAETHSATLVVNGQAETLQCVSEVGRYGVCFAENGEIISNEDVGYLVRTKAENINEGGVCAGYACLNSLEAWE